MLAFVGALAIAAALAWLVAFVVFFVGASRDLERAIASLPVAAAAFMLTFVAVLWVLQP